MSSLAAARADNFVSAGAKKKRHAVPFSMPSPTHPPTHPQQYYPPDHDPAKGSVNAQQGSHPLRARAARLASHGILVVRFELPFPVWCGGCSHLMAKGVRFNADKSAIGQYHTTTIWRFEMTTPCCGHRLVIRADPAARDFIVEDGGRRKLVRDAGLEAQLADGDTSGRAVLEDRRVRAAARSDAFSALETAAADAARGPEEGRRLVSLARAASVRGRNDYDANRAARDAARGARRAAAADRARGEAIGLRVPLLPASETDAMAAATVIGTRDGVRASRNVVAARAAALKRRAAAGGPRRAGGAPPSAVVVRRRQ